MLFGPGVRFQGLGRLGLGFVRFGLLGLIGPELLLAPDEAFEPLLHPNLHSIYTLLQQTLNPKP